jgi:hypothetical protein
MSVSSARRVVAAVAVLVATIPLAAQSPALTPGTRVRVRTVPYVVEFPGVRIEPTRITGSVVAQDMDTVTVQVAGEGPRTMPRANRRITGTVVGGDNGTLALRRSDGTTVMIPRAALGKVEQSAGRRSRGRNALWGLLVGAAGGAAMLAATHSCDGRGFSVCFGPGAAAAGGAIFGGGMGAGVGALVPGGELWRDVPLSGLP